MLFKLVFIIIHQLKTTKSVTPIIEITTTPMMIRYINFLLLYYNRSCVAELANNLEAPSIEFDFTYITFIYVLSRAYKSLLLFIIFSIFSWTVDCVFSSVLIIF